MSGFFISNIYNHIYNDLYFWRKMKVVKFMYPVFRNLGNRDKSPVEMLDFFVIYTYQTYYIVHLVVIIKVNNPYQPKFKNK